MGILHGRDLFSPRWITAQITDESNRLWFVPIRHTLGNWFLAKLDNAYFVFEIDSRAIRTYYASGVRTLRFLFYDVSSAQPLRPDQLVKLREFLSENKIKKVDQNMLRVLRGLKKAEKVNTESHDLTLLIEQLQEKKDRENTEEELLVFLKELDNKQISAPVEPISTFLDNDLKTTKASFLGNLFTQYRSLDNIHRVVTNRPQSGKLSWVKMGVIIMAIMGVATFAYIAQEEGWLDPGALNLDLGLTPTLGGLTQDDPQYWFNQYGDPATLAILVENGTVNKDDLPKEVWDIVREIDVKN